MDDIKQRFKPHALVAQATEIAPITFYLNDRLTPELVDSIVPPTCPLNVKITGYQGGGFKDGTLQNQAAQCHVIICNSLNFLVKRTEKPLERWAATQQLIVNPRAGQKANAYYDRTGLRFFFAFDKKLDRTVYTCESNDVVAHELGHAVLDAIRPDFWGFQSLEIHAFHEAFGDCNAILSLMQWDKALDYALEETGGDLNKSNVLSRIGEEFGIVVGNLNPDDCYPSNCLRDSVNQFKYTRPENLPSKTIQTLLSGEIHNFSRVWTGTWYEIMVSIYEYNCFHMDKKQALIRARDIMAHYLLFAVANVPASVRLYEGLAKQMLLCDKNSGSPYGKLMEKIFFKRKITYKTFKMLSSTKIDDFDQTVLKTGKLEQYKSGKTLKVSKQEEWKLIDHLGITAQNDNPLFNVKINVPMDDYYEFDATGNMIDEQLHSRTEVLDAAYNCLQYLHKHDMVGEGKTFQIKHGTLVRNHFACSFGCNKRNCKNPEAPEYGKCRKCDQHSGCGYGCGCDAPAPEPQPKIKTGCFTSVKTGGIVSTRVGSSLSRRVC